MSPRLDRHVGEHSDLVPESTLEILRCQQTLEPLISAGSSLSSPAADLTYPVRDGIVFMGYDEREHDFIATIIEAERGLQAAPGAVEPGLAYLRESSLSAIDLIRLVRKRFGRANGLRGLELGAGSGWASWLLAEAGYEMWACELEPNSVFLGQIYEHPRFGSGRRIACDATYVPFADRSFDLVLCKEFAHHVSEKRRLFQEANRVLKPAGLLVMEEPVRSVTSTIHDWRVPDPVPEHTISSFRAYLQALRACGFAVRDYGALSIRRARRVPFTAWPARRANEALERESLAHDSVVRIYLNLVGGALGVVAQKVQEARRVTRPRIRVIEPSTVQVSSADRAAFLPLRELLVEQARTFLTETESSRASRE